MDFWIRTGCQHNVECRRPHFQVPLRQVGLAEVLGALELADGFPCMLHRERVQMATVVDQPVIAADPALALPRLPCCYQTLLPWRISYVPGGWDISAAADGALGLVMSKSVAAAVGANTDAHHRHRLRCW